MNDISVDMVLQDENGCLTISGPLRLFARLMASADHQHQVLPNATPLPSFDLEGAASFGDTSRVSLSGDAPALRESKS